MAESGNSETRARDGGLRAIALHRFKEPMNTWPEHERRHRTTIMGSRLYDSECLRCHLEDVAAADARAQQKAAESTSGERSVSDSTHSTGRKTTRQKRS